MQSKWKNQLTGISVAVLIMCPPIAEGVGPTSEEFTETHLEAWLERAQEANPQLKAFAGHYEAAMQRIPQSSSLPDPMLQITHFVESVQTRTGPQENVYMLSQRIPWFGKLSNREEASTAEAEALWYAWQNRQLVLARMVSVAFYEYGYLEEAIGLTKKSRDLLQKLEPIVEEKVKGGGEINALLRLKVEIGKVDDRLQSFVQKRAAQSARLSGLLALPQGSLLPWPEWEAAPQPGILDGSYLAEAIRMNNPELQMLERKIASAEARREIARLESYPDLSLGLTYIQLGDPVLNSAMSATGGDPWGVSVAVNLPVWRSKYRAATAEAMAAQRAAESEYENRLNALLAELSSSLALLNDANRRLNLYGGTLLGLAEQAVENTRTSYENGRTGILEVIDSERSLLDLQLFYWRAASDAWQQRIIIQTLANQPIQRRFKTTENHE